MSDPTTTTYEYLLARYGPLLTLKHVAEIMHTTPAGVRMAIARRRQPFAMALSAARRRLGRRVYFEARRVANVIDQDESSVDGSHEETVPTKAMANGSRVDQSARLGR